MFNKKESLFLNVLKLLPDGIDCLIQAPSLEDECVLHLMTETTNEYHKLIKLDKSAKYFFSVHSDIHSIIQYFQHIEIRNNDKLLFEGFDGVEFGIISKQIELTEWFTEMHINTGDCIVSSDW